MTDEKVREGLSKTAVPFTHMWNGYPLGDFRMCDVLKRDVSRYADDYPKAAAESLKEEGLSERIISTAHIAHYIFKSEEDFARRAARGGFAAQSIWKERYERGEHVSILRAMNEVEDKYLADYWAAKTGKLVEFPLGKA